MVFSECVVLKMLIFKKSPSCGITTVNVMKDIMSRIKYKSRPDWMIVSKEDYEELKKLV